MSGNAELVEQLKQLALGLDRDEFYPCSPHLIDRAIAALSSQLAQQAEPVAWTHPSYLRANTQNFAAMKTKHPSFPVPLYTHPQPTPVSADWVLVPREPTGDMCAAAFDSTGGNVGMAVAERVYEAMIAAVPKVTK